MKFNIIAEESSKLSPSDELADVKLRFGESDFDTYIRQNSGVCFIFKVDPIWEVMNPPFSIIEVRNTYKPVLEYGGENKELFYKILTNHVKNHEMVHAAQVGGHVLWREFINRVGQFYLDYAIKKKDNLDFELSGESYRRIFFMNKTRKSLRENLIEELDTFAVQCLGTHFVAEDLRNKGVYKGMMENGIPVFNEEMDFNLEELLLHAPLDSFDDCLAKENYLMARNALAQHDVEVMKKTKNEIEECSNEMTGIIETMADSFSLLCDYEAIMNMPGKLPLAERKNLCRLIYDRTYARGLHADIFLNASSKTSTSKERNKLLREKGFRYQKIIGAKEHEEPVMNNLMKLGYHPINPFEAYNDVWGLLKRARENDLKPNDVLLPMNAAKAMLGHRYNSNLPLTMKFIEKYGNHEAFEKMLNVEKWQQIREAVEE